MNLTQGQISAPICILYSPATSSATDHIECSPRGFFCISLFFEIYFVHQVNEDLELRYGS